MDFRLFPLGKIVATPGALDLDVDFEPFLKRHQSGDWGNVSWEDAEANNNSLKDGHRVASMFSINDTSIMLVTEADRRATKILLPSELLGDGHGG